MPDLLKPTECGLYCEAGDFYVDPTRAVHRAVITHAHSDHARRGSNRYLCTTQGAGLLKARLGDVDLETVEYGETVQMNGVNVSLHPAGHILGSAQVRMEHNGEVWVVTGDYKTDPDPTVRTFELLECDTFVTECTFGLPVYRWPKPEDVFRQINSWWRTNQETGRTSVLFAYALGKAQRLLGGLDPEIGPIYTHSSVESLTKVYRQEGISLPPTRCLAEDESPAQPGHGIVVAPQSTARTGWLARFGDVATGFASGWMRTRNRRRSRAVGRGFVLSDHVDWPQLIRVIEETGASRVLATHGYADTLVRYLRSTGRDADVVRARISKGGDA